MRLTFSNLSVMASFFLKVTFLCTWQCNGPLLTLQDCTGHRCFAQACHVHSTHLELVEDVLLQVFSLKKRTMMWIYSNTLSPMIYSPRQIYYSISCGSQCLVVHFVPFSNNISFHGPVIHKISPHIRSPVIGWCCPAQHHVVFNSLQQGHASGPARDSWKESLIWLQCLHSKIRLLFHSGLQLNMLHALPTPTTSFQKC